MLVPIKNIINNIHLGLKYNGDPRLNVGQEYKVSVHYMGGVPCTYIGVEWYPPIEGMFAGGDFHMFHNEGLGTTFMFAVGRMAFDKEGVVIHLDK